MFNQAYSDAHKARTSGADLEEVEEKFLETIDDAGKFLEQFVNRYKVLMQRDHGPFSGCVHCPSKCVYRPEVKLLLSDKNRTWIKDELSSDLRPSQAERFEGAAQAAKRIAQNWLGEGQDAEPDEQMAEVGYCAALHTIASPDYTEYEQVIIANGLNEHIFTDDE